MKESMMLVNSFTSAYGRRFALGFNVARGLSINSKASKL